MDVTQALPLLGGISPQVFMKRHWQKKPLLVRQALSGGLPLLSRTELFELAASEAMQTRMVIKDTATTSGWCLKHGPFQRRALPPLKQPGWTILLQGVDLQVESVHQLMNQFRFVPDARLDDVMISYATDGGGVGPHFDSYDVFLLQAQGRRRWRIGRQKDLRLQPDMPLKILTHFVPETEYLLEPGDMLYLPPGYAHDGIAQGECMTYSIGFRIPNKAELVRELLQHLADAAEDVVGTALYRDPGQVATDQAAEIPGKMIEFAQSALAAALKDPRALMRGLGEYLTEPKPTVWFDPASSPKKMVLRGPGQGVRLDRRSRMMFDAHHLFINGESYVAAGRDAVLLRDLANTRVLLPKQVAKLSPQALQWLAAWRANGWLQDICQVAV